MKIDYLQEVQLLVLLELVYKLNQLVGFNLLPLEVVKDNVGKSKFRGMLVEGELHLVRIVFVKFQQEAKIFTCLRMRVMISLVNWR